MQGQILISLTHADRKGQYLRKLYIPELKLTMQSEAGPLGSSPVDMFPVRDDEVAGLSDYFRWGDTVEIPGHIVEFAQAYLIADAERSGEASAVISRRTYRPTDEPGFVAERDITPPPVPNAYAQLLKRQHQIGRDLRLLIAGTGGLQ